MKDRSPISATADKLRQIAAGIVVVIAGPLIAALVIIQLCSGVISVKGGDVTREADPFSFYLLNGLIGCVGIIALVISIATARRLLKNRLDKSKPRQRGHV